MAAADMSAPIKIRVGSQTFETSKTTLCEAPYFKGYFSESMGTKPGPDGAYFLDMKGDVFEHILEYLRHNIFPLIWTPERDTDVLKYVLLAYQADFLGLTRLRDWILARRYRDALQYRSTYKLKRVTDPLVSDSPNFTTLAASHRIVSVDLDTRENYTGKGLPLSKGYTCLVEEKAVQVKYEMLIDRGGE